MSASTLAVVGLVFCLASVVQAVTGFGFAPVAVPLLAVLVDPGVAVLATTVVSLVISLAAMRDDREHVAWREVRVVSLAGLVGMPLGLVLLTGLPDRVLTAVIAVALLAFTAVLARGLRVRPGRPTEVGVGVLSGALLTSTGMNGPPLVVAFQAQGMAPRTFRGTLSAVFVVQGAAGIALMAAVGEATVEVAAAVAVGLPALVIGWLVGNRAFHRLDPVVFRRIVLGLLVVSALVALVTALRG